MAGSLTKGHKWLIFFAVVALSLGVFSVLLSGAQERELQRKIADAKKAGFPFEAEDLRPYPPIPDADNAALLYASLDGIAKRIAYSDMPAAMLAIENRAKRNPLTAADKAALATYVRESAPLLDTLAAAAQRKSCYLDKDWDQGMDVLLPEYARIKEAAKILAIRAEMECDRSDFGAAQNDLETIVRAAEHCSSQPTLIALLVAIAVDNIAAATVQSALPDAASSRDIAALRAVVARLPEQFDITQQLRGEAFFAYWATDHFDRVAVSYGPAGAPAPAKEAALAKSRMFVRRAKVSVLEAMAPAIRDYVPYADEQPVLRGISTRMAKLARDSYFSRVFFDLEGGILLRADVFDAVRAKRRTTLAALDVLDFRFKNKRWPKDLNEAKVALLDPYNGKPLLFRVVNDGFRVYSVGPDLVDDGGYLRREVTGGATYDEGVYFKPK